jgi:hypothetical protein
VVFRHDYSSVVILSTVSFLEAFMKCLRILKCIVQRDILGSFRDSTTVLEDVVSLAAQDSD